MKNTLITTLALILSGFAAVFLLTGVRFGITHGEMRISPESQQAASQINRAGNVAMVLFLLTALLAAWLLLKAGPHVLPQVHIVVRLIGLLALIILGSWVLVLASVTVGPPDVVVNLEHAISKLLMTLSS